MTYWTGNRMSTRLRSSAMWTVSRCSSSGSPVVPRHALRPVDHVVALQGRHRDEGDVGHLEQAGEGGEVVDDGPEPLLVPVDEVHLVHGHDQVGDAQQGGDEGVAAGLLQQALAGVDQDHGDVGGRRAGDHVAGVLHVARRVGDDELAPGGGEVAVGDVDGDALLALGPQAVGEQGQVGVLVAALDAGPLHRGQLVLEDGLGVVQQPPDQRALAVVDGAGRAASLAEQFHQARRTAPQK